MSPPKRLLDHSAIGLSGLCLLHCLALPAFALVLPALGALTHGHWVHVAFVALAAPISALALARSGAWRSPIIGGLAAVGIGLLSVGAFGELNRVGETALTVAGGVCLATCHFLNLRRAHRYDALEVAHDCRC